MDFDRPMVWVIFGLGALAMLGVLGSSYLSAEARLDRRRRKSNARIVTKTNRPTVKFSVRTRKPGE